MGLKTDLNTIRTKGLVSNLFTKTSAMEMDHVVSTSHLSRTSTINTLSLLETFYLTPPLFNQIP